MLFQINLNWIRRKYDVWVGKFRRNLINPGFGGAKVMKKRNVIIGYLVLLMFVAALAGCAATRTHESTGEYVDDSTITTKVKALLAEDNFLRSFQISVETYKGKVQLSGFVNSQNAVDKAGQIAMSVKGVRSVKNNLIVK